MKLPPAAVEKALSSTGSIITRIVEVFLKKFERKHAADPKDEIIKKLEARIAELEKGDERLCADKNREDGENVS